MLAFLLQSASALNSCGQDCSASSLSQAWYNACMQGLTCPTATSTPTPTPTATSTPLACMSQPSTFTAKISGVNVSFVCSDGCAAQSCGDAVVQVGMTASGDTACSACSMVTPTPTPTPSVCDAYVGQSKIIGGYVTYVKPDASTGGSWWSITFDQVGTWTIDGIYSYHVCAADSVTPTPTIPVIPTLTPVPTDTSNGGGNGGAGGCVPIVPVVTAGAISTIGTLNPNFTGVVDKGAYEKYLNSSSLSIITSPYLSLWDSIGNTIQNFFVSVENILLIPFSYITANVAVIITDINNAVVSIAATLNYFVVIVSTAINNIPDILKAVITLGLGVDACLLIFKGRFGNS